MNNCRHVDHLPNVFPGWACCKCRTYNDYQRPRCRSCGHDHCYAVDQYHSLLPVADSDDLYDPIIRTMVRRSPSQKPS